MSIQKNIIKLLLQASSDFNKLYNHIIDELTKATIVSTERVTPEELYKISKACTPTEKERVQALLDSYKQALQSLIQQGITRAVMLSTITQQKAFDAYTRMQGEAVDEWRDKTANAFIRSRRDRKGGLNLSDRVWNYTQQTKAEFELAMSNAIEKGIKKGESAESLGRKIRQHLNNPDMMYRRYHVKKAMSDGTKKDVIEWRRRVVDEDGNVHFVKEDLAKVGTGVYRSARQNALRLTITETNMAYNFANCERWSSEPFVLGIRIRLSGNHPEEDICDELEGDYPKDFMWRGWHPRCMCSASSILIDRDSEEWKYLRSLPEKEYKAYKSPNLVQNVPEKFSKWCERNAKKLALAREKGKLPYFVKDNERVVGDLLGWEEKQATEPMSSREKILAAAKARHEARTDKQIENILTRWDERKYSLAQQQNFKDIENKMEIKRGISMDFEKANQGKGNIDYKSGITAFRVNCQSSVVAHELRMRGFDVTAQPNWRMGDDPEILSHCTWLCWRNDDGKRIATPERFAYKISKSGNIIGLPYKETIQQINEHTKEVGRYHVSFGWKGEKYGHIVTMERKADGTALWYDPQTGERNFFDKEYAKKIKGVRAYRVDNLVFDIKNWKVIRPINNEAYMTKKIDLLKKGNSSLSKKNEGVVGGLPKFQEKLDLLLKDNTIKIPKSRLENAIKSKNEFYKFEKEYNMCKVAVQNGHKVEMLEEISGVSSCDVLLDGKHAELKSITSVSNVEHRFNHAKEQGAEVVLFEIQTKNEKIVQKINELKKKGLKGYYYINGENILIEI